jgi:type II secretory pathway pseudopilin PulG
MQNEELKENQTDAIEEFEKVEIKLDSDKNEEVQEDVVQVANEEGEVTNNETTDLIDSDIANLSKSDAVAMLVKKAKILVDEADTKLNDCQATVRSDLQEYESAKAQLKETVVELNNELLKQLDYQQNHLEELEAQEEGIQYGDELEALEKVEESIEVLQTEDFKEAEPYKMANSIPPMYVQEPSSGAFGGFILGLIGGGATVAGMAYFAATKLGIKLDPSKMPNMETCKPIFEYYSKLVGQTDPNIGMGIMGGAGLLVLWILYAMKKSSKASKNLEFAKDQLNQAESYALQKQECKTTMDELDEHIKEAIETFKLYTIMLNEQKAKLNRIMYIEADKIATGNFHDKSLQEINDTRGMVESFKVYIATPLVNEYDKLSGDIKNALSGMKTSVNNLLSRLY